MPASLMRSPSKVALKGPNTCLFSALRVGTLAPTVDTAFLQKDVSCGSDALDVHPLRPKPLHHLGLKKHKAASSKRKREQTHERKQLEMGSQHSFFHPHLSLW